MRSRLEGIVDWNERLPRADWRADALARGCGVSERELRRYVRAVFGLSLRDWIAAARMERARALLQRGDMVKEAAARLGYSQAGNFSRAFGRRCGASPAAFRRGAAAYSI